MRNKFTIYRKRVDNTLESVIKNIPQCPALLKETMRYACTNGGKRLRPLLVYATCDAYTISDADSDALAAAIECIHAYSLIHDDLPAMDDDNLRRGKPTTHLVFGEALAILAGDALQSLAFQLILKTQFSSEIKIKMAECLSLQAGASGMVGGQALDILSENKIITTDAIHTIHVLKTGALIRASVLLGAFAANLNADLCEKLDFFATKLGLAFQLQDDLRDATLDAKTLGKNTGQDVKHQKSTYLTQESIAATRERIHTIKNEMRDLLQGIEKTEMLQALCEEMVSE